MKNQSITKRNRGRFCIFFMLLLMISLSSVAQTAPVNSKKGLAVQGYDVVAYFGGEAVEGNENFQVRWEGTLYYFSSLKNKAAFESSPERYVPQYGGYCAYAMAVKGNKVSINPKTFEVRGGKLYLFYNKGRNNTLEFWLDQGPTELVKQADRHWKVHLN